MRRSWNIDIPMPWDVAWKIAVWIGADRIPFPSLWWSVIGAAMLTIVGAFLSFLTGTPVIGILAALLFLMVLFVKGNAVHRARQRSARSILTYLQQAVAMQFPIPQMLNAAASGESRQMRESLAKLQDGLQRGDALSVALARSSPGLSPRVLGLVAAAERNGDLANTLQRTLDEPTADDRGGLWRDFGLFRSYLLILIVTFSGVMSLIEVFIYPKYRQILSDFELPLPGVAKFMDDWGFVTGEIIFVVAVVICFALAGRAMRQIANSDARKIKRTTMTAPMLNGMNWHVPIISSLIRDRDHSDLFDVLAASLDRGEPLHQAVDDALRLNVNPGFHRRLERCHDALQSGQSIADAFTAARFPPLIVGLCSTAARARDLPATMHFLARYYRWQFSRTLVVMQALAAPLTATVGGALVLVAWYWLYSPMLVLIRSIDLVRRIW